MEGSRNSNNKRKGDHGELQEGRQTGCKRQNETTVMEVFNCGVCSKPLRPPIYQCTKGKSFCAHLTTVHKFPSTPIELFKPFKVPVQPGTRVLKSKYNRLFLLNMEPLESYGHAVSLVCVQPETPGGNVRITMVFSCAPGHNQESKWEMGPDDGVPKQCLCIVPGKETNVVVTITIEREDVDDD